MHAAVQKQADALILVTHALTPTTLPKLCNFSTLASAPLDIARAAALPWIPRRSAHPAALFQAVQDGGTGSLFMERSGLNGIPAADDLVAGRLCLRLQLRRVTQRITAVRESFFLRGHGNRLQISFYRCIHSIHPAAGAVKCKIF